MDKRGRITIPEYMRKALGITDDPETTPPPLLLEAYPDLKNCKSLIIKKG